LSSNKCGFCAQTSTSSFGACLEHSSSSGVSGQEYCSSYGGFYTKSRPFSCTSGTTSGTKEKFSGTTQVTVLGNIDETGVTKIATAIKNLIAKKINVDPTLITVTTEVRVNEGNTNTIVIDFWVSSSTGVKEEVFNSGVNSISNEELSRAVTKEGYNVQEADIKADGAPSFAGKLIYSSLLLISLSLFF